MAEMAAMMRTRDRCHIATNKMTKPMMKMMSLEDKQNKDANKKKKKDKNSSGKKDKKKKKKNKNWEFKPPTRNDSFWPIIWT